jgi:hypothetical protein
LRLEAITEPLFAGNDAVAKTGLTWCWLIIHYSYARTLIFADRL